jgi:hypothetical protein
LLRDRLLRDGLLCDRLLIARLLCDRLLIARLLLIPRLLRVLLLHTRIIRWRSFIFLLATRRSNGGKYYDRGKARESVSHRVVLVGYHARGGGLSSSTIETKD